MCAVTNKVLGGLNLEVLMDPLRVGLTVPLFIMSSAARSVLPMAMLRAADGLAGTPYPLPQPELHTVLLLLTQIQILLMWRTATLVWRIHSLFSGWVSASKWLRAAWVVL